MENSDSMQQEAARQSRNETRAIAAAAGVEVPACHSILWELPPDIRLKIYEYALAIRKPTPRPRCPVHFPRRTTPKDHTTAQEASKKRRKYKTNWTKKPSKLKIDAKKDPVAKRCKCPPVEPSRYFHHKGYFKHFEEQRRSGSEINRGCLSSTNDPDMWTIEHVNARSEYPSLLKLNTTIRQEALPVFYGMTRFLFPSEIQHYPDEAQDPRVLWWLLDDERRKHLAHLSHVEWHGLINERNVRAYAAVIMLVELGLLGGTLVRRHAPHRRDFDMRPHNVRIATDEHLLCKLRVAVRERIVEKSITKAFVMDLPAEDLEELMCVVAKRWRSSRVQWWKDNPDTHGHDPRVRPCKICQPNEREPALVETLAKKKDDEATVASATSDNGEMRVENE